MAAVLTPCVSSRCRRRYLAARTGHKCVRINNHEHTDLQEYVGTYVTDSSGKLVFQEGALVTAMRAGHWIILDELNLAPTEVLEALNRLLDDNRELFIAETLETVKPHPNFMLWATQNPAGVYGGRKQLSQALKNRFLELHVDDIPGACMWGAVCAVTSPRRTEQARSLHRCVVPSVCLQSRSLSPFSRSGAAWRLRSAVRWWQSCQICSAVAKGRRCSRASTAS